ncbi:MAG: SulP family inorganic anion transporter [Acidimicrobiales bacterium]|nr:SulP family inorganic anion transporter [Acidimicrobiales bacterium]
MLTFRRFRPGWLDGYERPWLRADLVAGLTVWGLVVPEAIAYAGIAGLPPEAGLYTVLAGLVVYGLLGTSRQLVVSATSATAALIGATVVALHPADAAEYGALAAALVLAVAVLFGLAAVARLGFVTQFLSRPVTEGFIIGLALFVGVGQLPKLLGVEGGSGNVVEKLVHLLARLGDSDPTTVAVGSVALVALFALPAVLPRLPTGLIVIGVAIAASAVGDLERRGVEVVGDLPAGLSAPALPDVGWSALWTLVPAAAGIVLLAFSEGLAIAEDAARRHGDEVDAGRELWAYGGANVVSGLLGGLVAAGGMSATAVNDRAGARSQAALLVGAAATVVTLVALTPLFGPLPEAVLGALILHAVGHMLKVGRLRAVGAIHRSEMWLGVLAVAGVVLIDVLEGLVLAMATSLILHLYRSTRPHLAVLGRVPVDGGRSTPVRYGDVDRYDGAVTTPGVLVLRLDAPLYYANAATVRDRVRELVREADPPVSAVVLDPEVQVDLDVTSLEMLDALLDWLAARDVEVLVVRPHARTRELLDRAGLTDRVAPAAVVDSVAEGLARVAALDGGEGDGGEALDRGDAPDGGEGAGPS